VREYLAKRISTKRVGGRGAEALRPRRASGIRAARSASARPPGRRAPSSSISRTTTPLVRRRQPHAAACAATHGEAHRGTFPIYEYREGIVL